MSEKTCEQRVDEQYRGRIIEIARCLGSSEASERRREDFEQNILSVETVIVHKVLLSWGGPSDFFEIHVDPKEKEIVDIYYVFQDWFDGARRKLEGKAFDVVANMFDYLVYTE